MLFAYVQCHKFTTLNTPIDSDYVQNYRRNKKKEGIKILELKITCLFFGDNGLILAKNKEKAERNVEITKEIGGKSGLQPNEQKTMYTIQHKEKKVYRSSRRIKRRLRGKSKSVWRTKNILKLRKNQEIDIKMTKSEKLSLSIDGETYWKRVFLPSFPY